MANTLQGKRIVVGICGGIAAYKTLSLIRLLRQAQAEVRVVVTKAATVFVTPMSLQALSGNAVAESLLDPQAELGMGHIELAKWADAVVIAPLTANSAAQLAQGLAQDLLSTICLATTAPLFIAPAMNQQMFKHPATQQNLALLRTRGAVQIGPESGEQACGDVGFGRMAEPETIFATLQSAFAKGKTYAGLRVLITAGATKEPLDPVRFLTNHSSGKMGFALAKAFADAGAEVTVIAGSVQLSADLSTLPITRINVGSACEMLSVVENNVPHCDIFISCAAVADFRPETVSSQKLKKDPKNQTETMTLTLVKNPDIVAKIGQMTENRPFVLGFAAETENVADYAKGKLKSKNLDMICANDVSNGKGFNRDENTIHLFWKTPQGLDETHFPLTDKLLLAQQLAERIVQVYKTR